MKKYLWLLVLSLILSICMCFCLAACNENNDSGNTGNGENVDNVGNVGGNEDDSNTEGGNNEDGDKSHNTSPTDTTLNADGEIKELLSADELIEFHLNGNKYPEKFVFDELVGYGRVIKSSSTEDEVLAATEEHFTNNTCTVVENKLCVETELFYGVYVKWAYQSKEMTNPTYYDEYVVSFKTDAYDAENNRFGTINKDVIKKISDYIYYSKTYQIGGFKVYSSDINYKDGIYDYVIYLLEVCYGDWGVQDHLTFIKEERQIDEVTGEIALSRESLGDVFIDGDGMNYSFD